ncbi:unnamed protein product [Hymenolepis diminuta]|uniref:Protein PML n=1 Tax=Hymenolepis diminuta TaxID=6216 RepID=A0A0R3S801_HYMDI|nr:unnamed protein product [Hymenolepis diminuta]VUZ53372.1 unnamed protein product [Hymenolepis diminuta]
MIKESDNCSRLGPSSVNLRTECCLCDPLLLIQYCPYKSQKRDLCGRWGHKETKKQQTQSLEGCLSEDWISCQSADMTSGQLEELMKQSEDPKDFQEYLPKQEGKREEVKAAL